MRSKEALLVNIRRNGLAAKGTEKYVTTVARAFKFLVVVIEDLRNRSTSTIYYDKMCV